MTFGDVSYDARSMHRRVNNNNNNNNNYSFSEYYKIFFISCNDILGNPLRYISFITAGTADEASFSMEVKVTLTLRCEIFKVVFYTLS